MTQPNPPMSDLYVRDSQSNAAEYTVSEISGALKRTVEDAFGNVRVRGEISGYRGPHSSGHAYFALKDDRAQHRGRGLAHRHGAAEVPAGGRHGGDRHRAAHHLSRHSRTTRSSSKRWSRPAPAR